MRSDAAQIYERWWPVALRYASRWLPNPVDAEDVAACALVAFIEEAPVGLGDRAVERALARRVARSRERMRRGRRSGLLVLVDPQTEREGGAERDGATWERVRRALAPSDLAAFTAPDGRAALVTPRPSRSTGSTRSTRSGAPHMPSRAALASRRWRARHRAAAAALAVDDEGAGPTCARFTTAIPAVARKSATAEQRRALIEHTIGCDHCDRLLADRRAVARRWRIAGVVPGLFALRRFRRLGVIGSVHPLVTSGAVLGLGALVVASAIAVPVLAAPPAPAAPARRSHPSPPVVAAPARRAAPVPATTSPVPATTTSAPPPPATTTAPAPTTTIAAPAPAPSTSSTWAIQAQGLATPAAGGSVAVSVVGQSTHDGAIAATDVLTFSSVCATVQAATGPDGSAAAQLLCSPGDFPLTVTVTDAAGASATVVVGSP